MSIKPVLVPDHTADDLRRLMDSFADASTGPTRQELTESRAAVAAAPGVAEDTEPGTKMSKTCSRCGSSLFRFPDTIKCKKCNQTWKASPKNKEQSVAEGYDSAGAYDKWDPKHPDFVKNYRKFQASNPGATLKDFVADLKKGVSEGLDKENRARLRNLIADDT